MIRTYSHLMCALKFHASSNFSKIHQETIHDSQLFSVSYDYIQKTDCCPIYSIHKHLEGKWTEVAVASILLNKPFLRTRYTPRLRIWTRGSHYQLLSRSPDSKKHLRVFIFPISQASVLSVTSFSKNLFSLVCLFFSSYSIK